MKIIITESQYTTLIRRLDDFALIDRQFKLFLRKNSPCVYKTFDLYFFTVKYKTEDNVTSKLEDKKMLVYFNIKNGLELYKKVKEEISVYVDDNLKEYAEEYYNQYKEKHCLNR
jgi:hypothetical protein